MSSEPKTRSRRRKVPILEVIVGGILGVMLWRGVWGLFDLYFIPHNPVLSYWGCLIIPIVIGLFVLLVGGYGIGWDVGLNISKLRVAPRATQPLRGHQ